MALYAVINPATGLLTGGFVDSTLISPLPANSVPLTQAQWAAWVVNPAGYFWTGTTVAATTPSAAPPDSGLSRVMGGCAIIVTGNATLDATYPVDPMTIANLSMLLTYTQTNSAFPAGLTGLTVNDITGTAHIFGTTTVFETFVKALIGYVTQCQQYDLAAPGVTLPGPSITIA